MTNAIKRTFIIGVVFIIAFLHTVTNVAANSEVSNEIDLTIDGEKETIGTEARTVSDVLVEVDYKYKSTDKMNHELNDKVLDEMEIVVNSEKRISLSERGNSESVKTNAVTVEELLKELEIKVKENDFVFPSLESKLENGDDVAVIYYKEENYKESLELDFETEETFSFDVLYGEKVVEQEGQKGIMEKTFLKVSKNDITLSDEEIKRNVVKDPVLEKITVGTKEVVSVTLENETTINENDSMYVGESKVLQQGSKGIKEEKYRNDGEKRTLVSEKIVKDPVNKIIEKGTKVKPKVVANVSTSATYTLSEFQFHGVINTGGRKYTYYSQSVLPGGGLKIPGRHVNTGGYVADGNGFIVVASNSSIPKGSVIDTPFGYKGKVYDVCESCTPNWFDIYTR